jgi:peroxiredoxin Q/BCP
MQLETGDSLPVFKGTDQSGKMFDSSQLVGKAVVIYFYPKNFTPGCTKEACAFRDAYQDFCSLGAEVIGISTDSEKSHRRFADKYDLPFTLLSDVDGKIRSSFGVKKALFGLLPGRETFVFDSEGKLLMRFNSMDPGPHIRKAKKQLESIS